MKPRLRVEDEVVECSICMKHEMKWLVKQDIRMIVKMID